MCWLFGVLKPLYRTSIIVSLRYRPIVSILCLQYNSPSYISNLYLFVCVFNLFDFIIVFCFDSDDAFEKSLQSFGSMGGQNSLLFGQGSLASMLGSNSFDEDDGINDDDNVSSTLK